LNVSIPFLTSPPSSYLSDYAEERTMTKGTSASSKAKGKHIRKIA